MRDDCGPPDGAAAPFAWPLAMTDASKPAAPAMPGAATAADVPSNNRWMFETPPDLVCPITHEIFSDPVINCVGQVYDRASITRQLKQSRVDPITRLPLADTSLTPVFLLRSRAQQYRESAAAACVAVASSPGERRRALYLRRGVELAGEGGGEGGGGQLAVEGLSPGAAAFVAAHPAPADDDAALHAFAAGLRDAGLPDQAANVYLHLLQCAADPQAQAGALRQCLDCWTAKGGASPGGPAMEERHLDKLAALVDGSPGGLRWGAVLDIVAEARPGDGFPRRLCEQLLARLLAGGGGGGAAQEVLLKYTQLGLAELDARQQELVAAGAGAASGGKAAGGTDDGGGGAQPPPPARRRRKVVATALCALSFALNGRHAVARLARVLPVLYLVHGGMMQP